MRYDETDRAVLRELRIDSSRGLFEYAKASGIPKSTFHDRLKRLQKEGTRLVTLFDWEKIGLPFTICFYTPRDNSLIEEPCVNTCLLIGPDILFLECLFRTIKECELFKERVPRAKVLPVVETLKREGFVPIKNMDEIVPKQ